MNLLDNTAIEEEEIRREVLHIRRKRALKRKLIKLAVVLLAIIIVLFAVFMMGRGQGKKRTEAEIAELKETIERLEDAPIVLDHVASEISMDVIEAEIKNIGELVTVEYLFTDAAKFSDSKQIKNWNIPFTEKSFIIKWDGVIKAGIEIEKIDIALDESAKEIRITMPEAEITSYEVDESSVEVLDEKDNAFNKITIEDKVEFDAGTENAMKERAIENGLLDKAKENAETIIFNLLTAIDAIGGNYEIVFQ